MTEQQIRRILTIDGGGIKGVFPASFLASIEDTIGDKVSNYFDLIVGTSTGGIIALALGIGLSAKEILEFYEALGFEVFKGNQLLNVIRQIGFSKYRHQPLKTSLESKFGNRRLGESQKRLVIPSVNLENGEIYVYKTSHHPRLQRDYKKSIVEVALATSAAPSYFPTQVNSSGTPLIDGGLFANNPMGLAVVEAIGMLNWDRQSLKILSLGCTKEPLDINKGRKYSLGFGYWGIKIVGVFMAAQSSVSLGTAQLLAGHENVIRIDPVVPRNRFGIDTIQEIQSLKGLGDSEARKALPKLCEIFFNGQKVENFEPYFKLS
ncbi:MAG: CBASS cGAMP-activated phospholipase [Potamolinea sp.]